jgi:hypothetical protein
MMAITTRSSTNVNAERQLLDEDGNARQDNLYPGHEGAWGGSFEAVRGRDANGTNAPPENSSPGAPKQKI